MFIIFTQEPHMTFHQLCNVKCQCLIYSFQVTRVALNGPYSQDIKMINGVRQGAVLSPILFFIYFDELIHALKSAK